MTLKDANYEVERLENKLNKLLNDKEILEVLTDPKSTDYTRVMVDGGKHGGSLQEVYVLKQDLPRWQDLDKRIQRTQDEIQNYLNWIDKELKILDKYNKIEQLIVYYKEIDTKEYTWYQIASMVHYSISQCKKIYKRYKETRDIL